MEKAFCKDYLFIRLCWFAEAITNSEIKMCFIIEHNYEYISSILKEGTGVVDEATFVLVAFFKNSVYIDRSVQNVSVLGVSLN